jgi:hypothetical protein
MRHLCPRGNLFGLVVDLSPERKNNNENYEKCQHCCGPKVARAAYEQWERMSTNNVCRSLMLQFHDFYLIRIVGSRGLRRLKRTITRTQKELSGTRTKDARFLGHFLVDSEPCFVVSCCLDGWNSVEMIPIRRRKADESCVGRADRLV